MTWIEIGLYLALSLIGGALGGVVVHLVTRRKRDPKVRVEVIRRSGKWIVLVMALLTGIARGQGTTATGTFPSAPDKPSACGEHQHFAPAHTEMCPATGQAGWVGFSDCLRQVPDGCVEDPHLPTETEWLNLTHEVDTLHSQLLTLSQRLTMLEAKKTEVTPVPNYGIADQTARDVCADGRGICNLPPQMYCIDGWLCDAVRRAHLSNKQEPTSATAEMWACRPDGTCHRGGDKKCTLKMEHECATSGIKVEHTPNVMIGMLAGLTVMGQANLCLGARSCEPVVNENCIIDVRDPADEDMDLQIRLQEWAHARVVARLQNDFCKDEIDRVILVNNWFERWVTIQTTRTGEAWWTR